MESNQATPTGMYVIAFGKAFKVTIVTSDLAEFNRSGEALIATDIYGQMYGAEITPSRISIPERDSKNSIFEDSYLRLVCMSMGKTFEVDHLGECTLKEFKKGFVSIARCGNFNCLAKQYSGMVA